MQAWNQFIDDLRTLLGSSTLDPWLKGFSLKNFDAQNVYLDAQDAFHLNWFEEHIRPYVLKGLKNNNNHPIKVHVTYPEVKVTKTTNSPVDVKKDLFGSAPLDPLKTFETFTADESNIMILKLLKELKPTSMIEGCNPLYLWGPHSSGKSHLLNAACLHLEEKGYKVLMVSAHQFMEQVVDAMRNSKMQEFRHVYRHIDVLALDDVHLFAKKIATQEEFFHTFNTLHIAGKILLLSSICPPSEIEGLEPRLISRFEWGVSFGLEKVTEQELLAIFEHKLKTCGHNLSDSSKDYLLKNFGNSLTTLCQAIDALHLRTHLNKNVPDGLSLSKVTTLLQDLVDDNEKEKITPERIIEIVAETFGRKTKELLSKSQTKECAAPRQVAMYFLRHELGMPFKKIGELFSRDHSTVMSSIKLIEEKFAHKDEEVFPFIKTIRSKFNN